MNDQSGNFASVCAALLIAGIVALQPQIAQSGPLSHEQKYCVGMAGVTVGTMEMLQAGRRTGPQIHHELVRIAKKAGWPLSQTDFDVAINMGLAGVREGADIRATARFIYDECLASAWYSG